MVQRHYSLPSLKMLATFECAARRGSFKTAAAELNVTTSAISHQVKSLEQDLGVTLFERGHRAVQLTPEGRELMQALTSSFAALSNVVVDIRARQEMPQITIGVTTAVSTLLLTPLVTQFWRAHSDITVNQNVRDRPFMRPLQMDMVIEYATEKPKEDCVYLFGDELIPLCSPKFQAQAPSRLEDVAQSSLIHLDAAEKKWTNWAQWFEMLGYSGSISAGQKVNNYTIALQLAQDGAGVVLGWRRLSKSLLDDRKLVPFTQYSTEAPGAFYLLFKDGARKRSEVQVFSEWLIGQN